MKLALIIAAIVIGDFFFTWFLLWAIFRLAWRPLIDRYPPQPPDPEAVVQRRQTFRFGVFNLGRCVETAVDETHLHLAPARFLGRLGAKPISIPWTSIRLGPASRDGRKRHAKVDGTPITGPAWCLDLAEPTIEGETQEGGPV